MNKIKNLLACSALAFAFTAQAAPSNADVINTTPYMLWSGGTTNGSTTLSWVIVPAHSAVDTSGSKQGATPVVTSIAAYSDKLTGKVQTYKVLETTVCKDVSTTVSIPVNSTNTGTKWDSGTIIVRHMASDQYEKRTLATSGGATNLQVTAALFTAAASGDIVYKVSTAGAAYFNLVTNTVGANLMNFISTGEALVVGQPGMPLLVEVDATGSVGAMANVTAKYVPSAASIPRQVP